MLCESCRRREATVHLTEVQDGRVVETHRCDVCSQPPGVEPPLPDREVKVDVFLPAKPGEQVTVRAVHVPTGLRVEVKGAGAKEPLIRLACNTLRKRLNEREGL